MPTNLARPAWLVAALSLAVAAGLAFGQRAPKRADDHAPADTAVEKGSSPTQGTRIKDVAFENVPFLDVVKYLRDADPSFQAVVTYDPGAEPGGPLVQDLRLKDVPADKVLRLIAQAYPQIEATWNDDADGVAAWVIRVIPDPSRKGVTAKSFTTIHRLRETIDWLVSEEEHGGTRDPNAGDPRKARKQAIETVMSLLQASLETQGDNSAAPLLRLHPETETLLFKGTQEQGMLVSRALESLMPKGGRDAGRSRESAKLEEENQILRAELQAFRQRTGLQSPSAAATQPAAPAPAPATNP